MRTVLNTYMAVVEVEGEERTFLSSRVLEKAMRMSEYAVQVYLWNRICATAAVEAAASHMKSWGGRGGVGWGQGRGKGLRAAGERDGGGGTSRRRFNDDEPSSSSKPRQHPDTNRMWVQAPESREMQVAQAGGGGAGGGWREISTQARPQGGRRTGRLGQGRPQAVPRQYTKGGQATRARLECTRRQEWRGTLALPRARSAKIGQLDPDMGGRCT